jgi:hypothetical protein
MYINSYGNAMACLRVNQRRKRPTSSMIIQMDNGIIRGAMIFLNRKVNAESLYLSSH